MRVIATIGYSADAKDKMCSLMSHGINSFRFNLSKFYHKGETIRYIKELTDLKKKYGDDIYMMLDLPFPYQKPRVCNKDCVVLTKGAMCDVIFSAAEAAKAKKRLYINVQDFGDAVSLNDFILYNDGRHAFLVKKIISNNHIVVESLSDITVYPGKSLHINNWKIDGKIDSDICEKINELAPEALALSFVSSVDSVFMAQKMFSNLQLISKIETLEGVNNIDSISCQSDILIARGDLLLNVSYNKFYAIQKHIAQITKKNNRNLCIATGILSSLVNTYTPSQSEIVDLSVIQQLSPASIVLNYGVVDRNLEQALKILRDFEFI